MVNGIISAAGARKDELGDGNKGVPFLEQGLQNGGQGLGRMEGGVVKENDGAGLHLAGNPLDDFRSGQVLPVQTIAVPNRFKLPGPGLCETRKDKGAGGVQPPEADREINRWRG